MNTLNLHNFNRLMRTDDESIFRNIAMSVYYAFQRRSNFYQPYEVHQYILLCFCLYVLLVIGWKPETINQLSVPLFANKYFYCVSPLNLMTQNICQINDKF